VKLDAIHIAYAGAITMAVVAALIVAQRKTAAAIGTAANAINPFNHDNIFSTGMNSVVESIAGQPITLGTVIGDAVDKLKSIATGEPTPGEQAVAPSNAPGTPATGSASFPAPSIAVGRIGQYEIGL
jgi:hypothetical protein